MLAVNVTPGAVTALRSATVELMDVSIRMAWDTTSMFHRIAHLPDQMELWGPLRGTWAFVIESIVLTMRCSAISFRSASLSEEISQSYLRKVQMEMVGLLRKFAVGFEPGGKTIKVGCISDIFCSDKFIGDVKGCKSATVNDTTIHSSSAKNLIMNACMLRGTVVTYAPAHRPTRNIGGKFMVAAVQGRVVGVVCCIAVTVQPRGDGDGRPRVQVHLKRLAPLHDCDELRGPLLIEKHISCMLQFVDMSNEAVHRLPLTATHNASQLPMEEVVPIENIGDVCMVLPCGNDRTGVVAVPRHTEAYDL